MAAEGVLRTRAVTEIGEETREAYVARNFRHNYVLLLLDAISFPLGISFVSVVTILPLFVRQMTDSSLAVGLVPALTHLGTLLPPLFIANRIERLPLQKWYLFWVACVERAPFLVLAALIPWLGRANPQVLLVVFFIALAVHNFAMGLNMPSYFNLFSKVIPANQRGGMWGIGGAISGLLALGGAWLSGVLLGRYGFPDAYALNFLFAFIVLTLGIIGFRFVRELPTTDRPPPIPMVKYLRNAPALLRTDRGFGLLVLSLMLGSFSLMAPAFYTAYALDRFDASYGTVALFTTLLMAGSTVANPILGLLADRQGNKLVLQIGMLLAGAAALVALLGPSIEWMYLVFVLYSFSLAGSNIGGFNMPLEFAPRAQVPTYSAVCMTSSAPIRALAPMLGGLMLSIGLGYWSVFLFTVVVSGMGLGLLTAKVRDPRHEPVPRTGG